MVANKKSAKKKSADNASKSSGRSDAISLLKADHANVKDLFEQFEAARTAKQKVKLAQTICHELTVHTTIEEEIFYPAAREALAEDGMLDEAAVEHQTAKDLIEQIENGQPGEDMWEAKVKVLSEYINHHVEEEEKEMFPQVKKTDLDLKELGAQLAERKQELLQD